MVHWNSQRRQHGAHLHLSAQTEHILTALRFCLMREPNGEYRFTQVHLDSGPVVEPRAQFLMDLMSNRTLREVVAELTPDSRLTAMADSRTARELRSFFLELARVLEENPAAAPPTSAHHN